MSEAVRPPLVVRRPGLVRGGRIALVVLVWAVTTWLVGLVAGVLAVLLLLMALVLVPVGLVYGAVIRTVLLRRRRAARRAATGALPDGSPRAGLPAQRIDRWLAVLQLVIWACLGGLWVVDSALDAQGFVSGNTTDLGNVLDALGGTAFGMLLQVLLVIPAAAVLATRQATDRPGIEAEAVALAAGGADARAIRLTRTLSWIAYVISSAVGVGAIVALLAPR